MVYQTSFTTVTPYSQAVTVNERVKEPEPVVVMPELVAEIPKLTWYQKVWRWMAGMFR